MNSSVRYESDQPFPFVLIAVRLQVFPKRAIRATAEKGKVE